MELTQNPVPDALSIRAEMLTRSITRLNTQLVDICCAIQLIDTKEAFFSVKVLNQEGLVSVIDVPMYWTVDREPVEPFVKARLLALHEQLTGQRAREDTELHSVRRQLQALGKDSTIS